MRPLRAAIILAAGASERMGRPKALLAWHATTLLEYVIAQARAAGTAAATTIVVLGPATRDLTDTLVQRGVTVTFNPEPATGRSESIRLGSAALPEDVASIVVQSVDQPCPADVLVALFEAVEAGSSVAVPTAGGRRGHPIALSGQLLSDLRAVTEETHGLRAITRRHASREVPVASAAIHWNLNDPAAYAAALATQEQ